MVIAFPWRAIHASCPVEGLPSWCGLAAAAFPGSVYYVDQRKLVLPEWLFVLAFFLVYMGSSEPLRFTWEPRAR